MKSLSENDIKLGKVYEKDICHILRSHLATDINDDIIDAKLIFLKQYSDTLVNKVKSLISGKYYLMYSINYVNDDKLKSESVELFTKV